MKKIMYLLAFMPLLFSCGNNGKDGQMSTEDSLRMANGEFKNSIAEKDSSIEAFIRGFNEIQDNLDAIKEKEKIVSKNSGDVELRKTKEQQIIDDIQSIYDMMNKNKNRIASLKKKLETSSNKNEELEKFISRLTAQLEEKDIEIASLKSALERLNIELSALNTNYEELSQENDVKTQKLNEAYYAFGTSKELIANGVLTKEGGFIGIGKSQKVKADFNKNYFTKIDITQTTEIVLGSKKAKVVSTHPASSFKIEGANGKAEKLVITNADDFWSASKYLVIVVE
jgi:DNA repair exonuclease SbcCD ATPase subunit